MLHRLVKVMRPLLGRGLLSRALACAAASALVACASPPPPSTPPTEPQPAPVAPAPLTPAEIAARATPAVVTVLTPHGLGTGFVVRADGWVATNLHVVVGADSARVVLADESEHDVVEVVAFDEKHDLVVLRIAADDLPALALGNSDAVKPGEPVVAIGHPLGLADTISNGLVSAVRVVDPELTVLQISAPIAPGSSGGPLFNERGEVIGVAAAVSLQGQNLNFGIPVTYLTTLVAHPAPMSLEAFTEAIAHLAPPALPQVERKIPRHPIELLRGCSDDDLALIGGTLHDAIQVGAPLYNDGNFAACYHVYEGASLDVDRKLSPSCGGPKKALHAGRVRAAGLDEPSAQAWAMRDAFDGLLEVIVRKLEAAP